MNERVALRRPAVASTGGRTTVPPVVHEVLSRQGQPLPTAVRTDMEESLGHDFGRIRVHVDDRAAASAAAVGANAYTVGPDIVFGAGRYAPTTLAGRQVLVHELGHAIQQGQRHAPVGAPIPVGPVGDALETAAAGPRTGLAANHCATPTTLQRQPVDIPPPLPNFPTPYEWLGVPALQDTLVEAWNDTQLDDTERGYVVMWNEKTQKFWFDYPMTSRLTVTGNTYRHEITLPRFVDRPPVFPVGTFHTHPRPPKGMTSPAGPSSVDKGSLLPGVVEDSTVQPYDPRRAGFFFHGPTRRPETLPPGPLFP